MCMTHTHLTIKLHAQSICEQTRQLDMCAGPSRLGVANMAGHLWQQQRLVAELRVKLTNYFGKYLRDFDNNNVATPPLPLISFGFSFSYILIWFCRLRLLRLCSRVPTNCVCAGVHMHLCVCVSQLKQCYLKVGLAAQQLISSPSETHILNINYTTRKGPSPRHAHNGNPFPLPNHT